MGCSPSAKRGQTGDVDTKRSGPVGTPKETDYDVIETVAAVADQLNTSSAAVAFAWVQGRPEVASTLIGARSLSQLRGNLDALDLSLPDEHRSVLDKVSKPSLNFPAHNNATLGPILGFPGTTVDGVVVPSPSRLAKP